LSCHFACSRARRGSSPSSTHVDGTRCSRCVLRRTTTTFLPSSSPPSFPGSSLPCLCLRCSSSSSHSRLAVQLLLLPLPLLLPPLYAYIGRNPPLLAAAPRPARSNSIHEYLHGSVDAR
jgi:hypothetical protein